MSDTQIIDWIEQHGIDRFRSVILSTQELADLGQYGFLTVRQLWSLALQSGRVRANA